LGGRALEASDEFLAEKENLLKEGRGVFLPDKYTDRGKWMDGWESRRKRVAGHDWCVIRLGLPGEIHGLDIDTNHFLGNHPPYASVEGAELPSDPGPGGAGQWIEVLPRSPLKPGSRNLFASLTPGRRLTHLRLNIYPDGGVARFRAYGEPRLGAPAGGEAVDLAALVNGGRVVACNDMFFGNAGNMILPGRGVNMGDGWETRRRREPGFDWAVIRLAARAAIERIELDTHHFKGNFPDRCSIDGLSAPGGAPEPQDWSRAPWRPVLIETALRADASHAFDKDLDAHGPFSHLRLCIHPDGGVSRLRVFGRPA